MPTWRTFAFEFYHHGCFMKISVFWGITDPWVLKLANPFHLRYDCIVEIMVDHCPLNKPIKLGIKTRKYYLFDFMTIEIKVDLYFQATKKLLMTSSSHSIIFSHLFQKNQKSSIGWVAQLVGMSSCTPKGCTFNSQSGHILTLQV